MKAYEKKDLTEKKEGIFKKAGRTVREAGEWLYDKRYLIGGIAIGIFAIYAKGRWDGEVFNNEVRERNEMDRLDFLKALVGGSTGLTEDQIEQAQLIKDMVDNMDIDTSKLGEIYDNWSGEDWDDFMATRI